MEYQKLMHIFEPIFDENSRILILGTFPSVKSRENRFYYGHPQNRFWKVLVGVCREPQVPDTIEEKRNFLLAHHIAIWDVIAECEIMGSSDSSIRNVVPNDLRKILDYAPIQKIYANGGKAYELYQKYSRNAIGLEIEKLPSTSPANASFQMPRLLSAWEVLRTELESS